MNEKQFKVIIVGDLLVGKTSFIIKFTQNKFSPTYKATLGSKAVRVKLDCITTEVRRTPSEVIRVALWDICGQENSRVALMPQFCRGAHACVIMVDITNKASLEGAKRWKETVDRQALLPNGNSIPCLLLANKCDLPVTLRQVTQEEITKVSEDHNFIKSVEISVKENQNVVESVEYLVDVMLAQEANSLTSDKKQVDNAIRDVDFPAQKQKNVCCN